MTVADHTPPHLANIAAPADAQHVEPWVDETSDGSTWGRHIRGTRRATAGGEVVLCGWQDADGAVERHASLAPAAANASRSREASARPIEHTVD